MWSDAMFDSTVQSYLEAIKSNFKTKTTFKGKLDSYRFIDNVSLQHALANEQRCHTY